MPRGVLYFIIGPQAGVMTEAIHTRAKILNVNQVAPKEEIKNGNVVVITGFQGINQPKRYHHNRKRALIHRQW